MGRTSTMKLSPVIWCHSSTLLAGFDLGQGDHVQVGVPLTGVVSALHFVGPHSTHNTIEHRAATALAAFP
jgi:hypothetical protein